MATIAGKNCCNCQYWNGARKVTFSKDRAEVKSSAEKGICMNNKSFSTKGKSRDAGQAANCNHFERWDQLK